MASHPLRISREVGHQKTLLKMLFVRFMKLRLVEMTTKALVIVVVVVAMVLAIAVEAPVLMVKMAMKMAARLNIRLVHHHLRHRHLPLLLNRHHHQVEIIIDKNMHSKKRVVKTFVKENSWLNLSILLFLSFLFSLRCYFRFQKLKTKKANSQQALLITNCSFEIELLHLPPMNHK